MRKKRRWIILGVAVLLLAGNVAGYLVIRSAWFKNWQATRLARASLELIAKEEYSEAYQKTAAAMQLAPDDPEVLRSVAKLHFISHSPQAVMFYRALIDTGEANETDLLDASEAALALREFRFYDEVMAMLAKKPPASGRYYMLQGSYAVLSGNMPLAIELTRKAVEIDPKNPEFSGALGQLLMDSGQAQLVDEGRAMLEKMVAEPGGKVGALKALIASAAVPDVQRLQYAEQLLGDADAGLPDKLQAAEIVIRLDPSRRASLLASLIAKYGKGGDEQVKELGAWLVRIQDPAAAEQILPLQKAMRRKDFFLIWLDATAGQNRWEDIRAVLSQKNVPIEPALQFLFQGRAALQLGSQASAEQYFRKAVYASERDPVFLVYLAGYFRTIGQQVFEIESLERLTGDPAYARFACDALLELYRRNADARGMLQVLEKMKKRWPVDIAVQNDVTYLKLIFNEQVSTQLFEASERFKADPHLFPLRMTYALALLRNGQGPQAMELLENSQVKFGELLPWQRAIFAAILANNGRPAAALSVVDGIPDRSLTPAEGAFLESYMLGSGAGTPAPQPAASPGQPAQTE